MIAPLVLAACGNQPPELLTFNGEAPQVPSRFEAALDPFAERFVDFERTVEALAFTGLEQRVATALVRLMDGDGLARVTHEDLAVEIGSAREAVSRLLSTMAKQGILAMSRDALMPGGVDSNKTSIDSLKIGQAPRRMTPTIRRLTSGSRMVHPVRRIAPPLTITPSDTQASPTICQNALRIFRSSFAPCWSNRAMPRLATKLTAAITITHPPSMGTGCSSRFRPTSAMPAAVSNRMKLFRNAAMIPARW